MRGMPKSRRRPTAEGREGGQTLVVTLVVLAFVTALLGTMSVGLLAEARLVQQRGASEAAYYAAKAGIEVACSQLLGDDASYDSLRDVWHTDRGKYGALRTSRYKVEYNSEVTGGLMPGIVDEERKLNINTADRAMLGGLTEGVTDETAKQIIDKRPFAGVEDLLRVPGIDRAFLDAPREGARGGLASLLTVYGSGKVNVNTAPQPVLTCLSGVTRERALKLVTRREESPFTDISQVRQCLEDMDAGEFAALRDELTVSSSCFTIVARGHPQDEPRLERVLRQTVRRDGGALRVIRFEIIR